MSAAGHVDLDQLLAYYLGEPMPDGGDAVEAHLFECTACGERLDALHRTASATVALVRRGEIGGWGTSALANRMARDRLHVRQYVVEPGDTLACTVAVGDDYLMGRFVLPAGDVGRVDLRVLDAEGTELMRVEDLVVDARHGHAIMFMPARAVLGEGSALHHYVLVTPAAQGERELGRYAMDHTGPDDG